MARIPGTTFSDTDYKPPPPTLSPRGFPTGLRFEVGKQKPEADWKRPGKPEWPNFLTVQMNRYKALDTIKALATALQDNDREDFTLSFAGELIPSE